MKQIILEANAQYDILDQWFTDNQVMHVMLVCGKSIYKQKINDYLEKAGNRLGVEIVRFMEFQPNPLYENVLDGIKLFRKKQCDAIIAVGGGSAMDVAKCIKLYSSLPGEGENGEFLTTQIVENSIPFLAMPTTAGTGSEATRYAVIYYEGKKQSVSDSSCIPGTVLMDSSVLKTLPEYYRKSTMFDALSHAIESFWSVNSTDESKEYSRQAIQKVFENLEGYLANTDEGNAGMLLASNLAGKAINITQTTAGHAMCYKITSIFGCAHGHAAALCNRVLYEWMLDHTDRCIDNRGTEYVRDTLDDMGHVMGCEDGRSGAKKLKKLFEKLALTIPAATAEQFEELKTSVNPVRLKNHPIELDEETIGELYHNILNGDR